MMKDDSDRNIKRQKTNVKRAPFGLVDGGVVLNSHHTSGGHKIVFAHGNYAKYYSSRRHCVSKEVLRVAGGAKTNALDRDVRLQAVNAAIDGGIEGHTILDIGCNEGILPIEMGALYDARWVEGTDIDLRLIKTGNKTLREIRSQVLQSLKHHDKTSEILENEWTGLLEPISRILPKKGLLINRIVEGRGNTFPYNLRLLAENLTLDGSRERCLNLYPCANSGAAFDMRFSLVTMFSVVKWIHLAYGDAILKRLLRRVYNLICEGGYFVLEPQNYHSYANARKNVKTIGKRNISIRFKPHEFDNYLVTKVGFRRTALIVVDTNATSSYRIIQVGDTLLDSEGEILSREDHMASIMGVDEQSSSRERFLRPIFIYQKITDSAV